MIKILNLQDIDKIPEKTVAPYVYSLITNLQLDNKYSQCL